MADAAAPDWVVVTGAGGGIGQACIPLLRAAGYALLLVDVPASPLGDVAGRIDGDGGPPVASRFSRLDGFDECQRVLAAVDAPLYGLVHLAGVFETDPELARDHGVWDRAIAANLTSAYDLASALERRLPDGRHGRLLFTSSLAFRRGAVDHVAYSAAKGGLVGLTRALARRFAERALVNGLAPGIIDTRMPAELIARRRERLLQEIPLKRFGAPAEVATVIRFLLSDDASYITGQVLNIDGGLINA